MRLLLVADESVLGRALRRDLGAQHDLRVFEGDGRDRETAARATADVDAIVLVAPTRRRGESPTDLIDRATRATYNLITTGPATRIVLVSSLRFFERYPLEYLVTEYWAPRPTTDVEDLAPFLAEAVVREHAREAPVRSVCLRLGEVVDEVGLRKGGDPRFLHVEDALQAVERALAYQGEEGHTPSTARTGWSVFHIVGKGRRTRFPLSFAGRPAFGYKPRHDVSGGHKAAPLTFAEPRQFTGQPGGAARKVVMFGAGGPLGAITTSALERDHILRLTDLRAIETIVAENKPQSPGAPFPHVPTPPSEWRAVDVTRYDQVLAATRGMDAVVNCTVLRHENVQAFRVNALGAYNVMRSAVECGIRRVVHTGPQLVTNQMPGGYWPDFGVSPDVPPRPGGWLYGITKFLGHEICRIFAEEHDLEVPTLYFSSFVDPATVKPDGLGGFPFSVSWADSAEAMRLALRLPSYERPFQVFHIVADLPHGKYPNDVAKRVLGWQPRDRLEVLWRK